MRSSFGLLLALLAVPPCGGRPAEAKPPRLENARLDMRSAASGLPATVREIVAAGRGPAWIGYAVAAGTRDQICCYDSAHSHPRLPRSPGCRLEGNRAFTASDDGAELATAEGPAEVVVLLRAAAGRIGEVRVYSSWCGLDAGGLPFHWLNDVRPSESLALLRSLVEIAADEALTAIAQHADPGAVPLLIDFARHHPTGEVRSQSLFWLAQKAGREAAREITGAIAEDPETEVKKQAVFALSELPDGQGVPLLIELARANHNPAVREQAFFWLGESDDPRALAFFEEVLTR